MAELDNLKREIAALRGRIATLNAAILRINASLDLDTVLGEVVESARALTGARWGVIATVDEAGAADYIVKPFSPTELTARVGAALRARAGAEPFVLGALAIDYTRRRVTVDGRAVALTATEYEILRILSVNAGRVVTSESLLRQAWDSREPTDTERVRAFVKQIRAKLGEDASNPAWIFNERGVGYRMAKPGDL